MLSMIQKDRPCVPSTTSPSLNCRSWTGTMGRLSWIFCQLRPSFGDIHTPRSVPAKSSPRRSGSSRTTRVNSFAAMPLSMRSHVEPQFVVFQLETIARDVGDAFTVRRRIDDRDARVLLHVARRHLGPGRAAVARDPDAPIVRSRPEIAGPRWRLGDREHHAVVLDGGLVER